MSAASRHQRRLFAVLGSIVGFAAQISSGGPTAHVESGVTFAVAAPTTQALQSTTTLPISAVFVPNGGRYDARVRYYTRGSHRAVFATDHGVTLAMESDDGRGRALRLSFVDAQPTIHAEAAEPAPGRVSYLIGRDARQWQRNVPTYRQVLYREVWPGIDACFVAAPNRIKYEFHLRPGADASRIKLEYEGADALDIDPRGELRITAGSDVLMDERPRAYSSGVATTDVAAAYVRTGIHEFGIAVGDYDRTRPLVIDPAIVYASYLGGSNVDDGNGIAVDGRGSMYVVGTTGSVDFPVTPGAYQAALGGAEFEHSRLDAFVAKVSADGSELIYATYLGGTNEDYGNAIALDPDGNAYVTGSTMARDFPTTPDAFQPTFPGGESACFITKLDPTGSALVYSTYYGADAGTSGAGIATDASGRAYIAGSTSSRHLPGTDSGFGIPFGFDGFLIRLGPASDRVEYGTYIGGSRIDYATAVAVLGTTAYVGGSTESYDFPTTPGAFDPVGVSPLLKTVDGAVSFHDDHGLLVAAITAFAQDPSDPAVIYAGTAGQGVFKSIDGGASFMPLSPPLPDSVVSIAIDPTSPTVLYASVYGIGVYVSRDGGVSWTRALSLFIHDVSVDSTGVAFAAGASANGVWRSTDNGANWMHTLNAATEAVLPDPAAPGVVLAGGYGNIYRSTDGGTTWTQVSGSFGYIERFRLDLSQSAVYLASRSGVWRSDDDGLTFVQLPGLLHGAADVAIDASTAPPTIYSLSEPQTLPAILKSTDGGDTAAEVLVNGGRTTSLRSIAAVGPSALLLGGFRSWDAFVVSIDTSASGPSSLLYSTYLSGSVDDLARGIAVDAAGRAYVAGASQSGDFPVTVSDPPRVPGVNSAWAAELSADGSSLVYANALGATTGAFARAIAIDIIGNAYIAGGMGTSPTINFAAKLPPDGSRFDALPFGGSQDFGASAIAAGRWRTVYVIGSTGSADFPVTENSFQSVFGGIRDAFVVKIVF